VAPRLAFSPAPAVRWSQVRAGRPFRVELGLEATGTPSLACSARVGATAIRATARYASGLAACWGTTPKGAVGKRLAVTYRATLGGLTRTTTLSAVVR
jgi:hypothetical protein